MSHTAPLPHPTQRGLRASFARILRWHAFCIPLSASGCFFFLPLTPEEDNVAPEILISVPDEGEDLILDRDPWLAYVIADDEDGDPLVCEWVVDGFGSVGSGDAAVNQGRYGCTLSLPRNPDYDGHTLTVYVIDPYNDFAERSWAIDDPTVTR